MKNKLIAFIVFLVISVITLLVSGYMGNTKSVDLSDFEIDNMKINSQFEPSGFKQNHNIQIDNYKFFYNEKHPNFFVKVDKHTKRIKGMILINDKSVKTNKNFKIGDSVDDVIDELGSNYQMSKTKHQYKTLTYTDKEHHLRLKILYQNDEIRRIEYFKW